MAGVENEIRRAVIIDPAFLGDVVFDAPLVRALRDRWPECRIGIVVRPPADAIARAMPGVARVHVFDKKRADRGWSGLKRVAAELESERYDLALIPHPSVRSTLLAYLAGIPVRRGNAPGFIARAFLNEFRRAVPGDTFIADRLRLLDDPAPALLAGSLELTKTPPPGRKPRIGLVLGSQWPTKRWAPERATEFVRRLDPAEYELVLIGARDERPLYDALGPLDHAIDELGGTVDELLTTIAGCDLLIAGDTGPLHIARAFGVPTVALFGPTPETRHTFTDRDRVLAVDLSCRPCSPHGDLTCPEGHHRCMRELSAESVHQAMTELLAPREREDRR